MLKSGSSMGGAQPTVCHIVLWRASAMAQCNGACHRQALPYSAKVAMV